MKFHLFTDGACQPNPGNGGWAFIAHPELDPKNRAVHSGYQENTTNNRMEMTAVVEGLKYLTEVDEFSSNCIDLEVVLYADSKYLINGIQVWMHNWCKNNWRKKDNKPVLNSDLWKQLHALSQKVKLECEHIKGHSGHPENEECDQLAVAEISKHVKT
jgi:ribonuclease HI